MKHASAYSAIVSHVERTDFAQRKAGRGIRLLTRGNRMWVVRAGAVAVPKSQQSWRFS